MAKFLGIGLWEERQQRCPHVVVFEKKNFFRGDNFETVQAWLNQDELVGFYITASVNDMFTYSFSDANTAFLFKMHCV